MSIWIRISNSAFKVSLEHYQGFRFFLGDCGIVVHLGCFNVALFWNMGAIIQGAADQAKLTRQKP